MDESAVRALAAEALAPIAPEADLAAVGDDEDLREALDLDSMDFMNFVVALAQASATAIPASEMGRFRTMRGLLGYFAGRAGSAAAR